MRRREPAQAVVERALQLSSRFVRHTCYTRGVTRYYLLRRAGYAVSLVFGLDPHGLPPNGHCWIVLDGRPYLEPDDGRLGQFVETWSVGHDR